MGRGRRPLGKARSLAHPSVITVRESASDRRPDGAARPPTQVDVDPVDVNGGRAGGAPSQRWGRAHRRGPGRAGDHAWDAVVSRPQLDRRRRRVHHGRGHAADTLHNLDVGLNDMVCTWPSRRAEGPRPTQDRPRADADDRLVPLLLHARSRDRRRSRPSRVRIGVRSPRKIERAGPSDPAGRDVALVIDTFTHPEGHKHRTDSGVWRRLELETRSAWPCLLRRSVLSGLLRLDER